MVVATSEGTRAARWPILAAIALLGFAALFALAIRVTEPQAISPWESAIAMEGMRARAGLPLYDSSHATHLYGPLLTLSVAFIFAVTGLNLLAARIVFCAVGVALAFVCARIGSVGKSRENFALSFAMFLAIGWRTNFINYSAQPDAIAALLAIVGLVLFVRKNRSVNKLLALVLLVAAVFFKQTSAAFALVPVVHAAISGERSWRRFTIAGVPAATVLFSLLATRIISPALFHGMIVVPASLAIHWERALPSTLFVLATFPILYVAWLKAPRLRRENAVETWSIAAMIVLVPLSIWTMLKSGGGYSSLFPGYLAILAFVSCRFDEIIRSDSVLNAVASVGALLVSIFFQIDKTLPLLSARAADDHYEDAIAVARQLGSDVISPQDPTISFRANGSFSPALFFELDTSSIRGEWPVVMPPNLAAALSRAHFVVEAESYVPVPQFAMALAQAGFHKVEFPQLANSAYSIWEK